jgi:hypothetical protein
MTVLDHTPIAAPESLDADITAVLGGWRSLTRHALTSAPVPGAVEDTIENILNTAEIHATHLADSTDSADQDLADQIQTAVDIAWANLAGRRVDSLTPQLAQFTRGAGRQAEELARRLANEIVAHTPGMLASTDKGTVQYSPDRRYPDAPFVSWPSAGLRYGRADLGEITVAL